MTMCYNRTIWKKIQENIRLVKMTFKLTGAQLVTDEELNISYV